MTSYYEWLFFFGGQYWIVGGVRVIKFLKLGDVSGKWSQRAKK